ncbi:TetR/AcrR family transcriptional regulator [Paracoccus sp. Ld10]|uniref:TetR/AcrR family transcriptional regulator n=1 Tax=Paracoccus sp. Ld10 TaxID=649158 RepID=UPI003863ADD4
MNTDTAKTPAPGITRGRKFDQVRDGAAVIFLRDGYAAASVDDIARSARVSKATLYSYFPDKSLMFREVLRATMDSAFRQQPFDAEPGSKATAALPQMLSDLADWALSEPRLSLLRVMTAESTRFPDDARDYDDALARCVAAPLARIIDGWIASGQVRDHDSGQSARQLVALITGQVQQPALLTGTTPPETQIARITRDAASLFLSAHALRAA